MSTLLDSKQLLDNPAMSISPPSSRHQLLRALPSISRVLETDDAKKLAELYGSGMLKYELRLKLEDLRERLLDTSLSAVPAIAEILAEVEAILKRRRLSKYRRAINATGVLLHTNLGRAPIASYAVEHLAATAGYGLVQVRIEDNSRSDRDEDIAALLKTLTGCEAATVVNNNAAATFMLLYVMAAGKEIILSRGQLVEIGGSYRMPDVIAQSGVVMREVGTTNKTHLADYERAITENTAALLYVDPSNYQVIGFAGFPSLAELCELGKRHGIPVIADLGSGALVPTERYGIKHSITIAEALAAGATVTCSSGDKLIGGPQAGVICGAASVVKAVRKSPFARMFRVDKLTLAGLEATLQEFVNGTFETTIPLYQMLSRGIEDLRADAERLQAAVQNTHFKTNIEQSTAYIGGGSLPTEELPSFALRIECGALAETGAKALRVALPSIFCRIESDALLFDMRTLLGEDLATLCNDLGAILTSFTSN